VTATNAAAASPRGDEEGGRGNEITRQAISPKATSTSIAAEASVAARKPGFALPAYRRGGNRLAPLHQLIIADQHTVASLPDSSPRKTPTRPRLPFLEREAAP
jgi:hypothetical protein